MKHAIILITSGLLHLIPPTCIAILSTSPSELITAITVSTLFFSTLGLGYWHGHHRTWCKADHNQNSRKFVNLRPSPSE